ncbi:MAG: WD40/YVTN/BNR-like repeat-containing protein [Acidimicrobiales bacterium]
MKSEVKSKDVLAATALFVGVALAAGACGGSPGASKTSSGPSTSTTGAAGAQVTTTVPVATTARPTSTTSAPTTSGATGANNTGGGGPGGPVPSGFNPVSFTAVSDGEYWLLGSAPCSNPVCTSIVRTTDGGAHFVGIPAPAAPIDTGQSPGAPVHGAINTLRFADRNDGYAFDTNRGGSFWDTHDGGQHWAQSSSLSGLSLLSFGTGGGYAFALVGTCQNGSCSDLAVERSPVGSDSWAKLQAPLPAGAEQVATMTVQGADLWFSMTTSANQPNQVLVAGSGSGSHFTTYTSPCGSGLAGTIDASSPSVVWAVCPTGMMAEAERSTDGGAHWQPMATGELENSALLAPASDTTAVLQPSGQGQLLRTTDGGSTWQPVTKGPSNGYWAWVGFTDASTASGLWASGGSGNQLWRSTDGGATWAGPVSIG